MSSQRIEPGPGQESAWDYPRPPRLEPSNEHIEVVLGGEVIASSDHSLRVLETSHPPTYYLPLTAFASGAVRPAAGSSYCEWKGQAAYVDLVSPTKVAERAGWTYPDPTGGYTDLVGYLAIMPGLVDEIRVDGEVVTPQAGGFYGGWITSRVVGPFKGEPGTLGW